MSKWLPWMRQAVADACQHPTEPDAALARWNDRSPDAFRKAKKRCPEFAQALQDAREGKAPEGEVLSFERFVREVLELELYREGGTIYERVFEQCAEINSGQFDKVVLTGGIGSGKTTCIALTMAYQLYRLMMQPDPHEFCKIDSSHPIIFACANKTKRLAKLNDFAVLYSYVSKPKFQALFPFDQRIKSRIVFLKSRVEVWPISSDTDLLGMSAYAVAIDEINFYETVQRSKRSVTTDRTFDAGRETYEGISRRLLSRLDEGTGMLMVASSNRFKGELTGKLIDELRSDAGFFHYHETAWTACPDKYKDSEHFLVFVGDQNRSPRILGDDEETDPADRHLIEQIPAKFKRQFRSNISRSLQDIGGISLTRVGSFFTSREKVNDAATLQNALMRTPDVKQDARQFFPGIVDLPNPQSPRAIHCDLSLSSDLTGICVAHVSGFDDQGRQLITVDALGRIHPPGDGGQIDLNSIYELVLMWKRSGVPVEYFSCDQYQSSALMQRVGTLGIRTGKISVDMTSHDDPNAAYENLRLGVTEGRVKFPYDETVIEELLSLEHDRKRNRVDHPPNGSKDSADALAGAVFQLSRIPAWQLVDKVKRAGFAAAVAHTLGGQVTSIRNPGSGLGSAGVMSLIRQARGMPRRY